MNGWIPLALGLTGSVHCLGMCGPLIMSASFETSRRGLWPGQLVYHLARVVVYGGMGLFFGLIGKTLVVAGLQQILAVAAGLLMVAFALFGTLIESWLNRHTQATSRQFFESIYRFILRTNGTARWLILGALNGIIPCGLVYAALAGAIATGSAARGAEFMMLFGLGTWPLLLAAGFWGSGLYKLLRGRVALLRQAVLLITGLLLIQRGFSIDLTLFESAVVPAQVQCHGR